MQQVRQLAQYFTPINYKLQLSLARIDRKFSGIVTITGTTPDPSQTLTVHSKDLTIKSASIDGAPAAFAVEGDELTLTAAGEIAAGEHVIEIAFAGTITDSLHGLYPGYFTHDGFKKEVLVTQFESHHAREVFPCIDEPAAKATFDLALTTDKGITALANTPLLSQQIQGDYAMSVFATTPKMSTYLLAFVAGEFEYLEAKTHDGIMVRAYATPGQAKYTQFALDVAVRALEFYNNYFKLPYPLPKCDLIGIPDFSAGAMENWGCVTFRENCFLVDEKNTDVSTKQYVAQVVIHELAHQWFGNLVTMRWWNDLWLNEGFARFMESFVADRLFPEWNLKTEFLAGNVAIAQRLDSLASTHPIQVEINHPDEISTIFDTISYEKGAAALLMLHNYLGEADFQKGLGQYLAAHQGGNTVTDDLWQALSDASGKDVKAFMHRWITQPGFPMVSVTDAPQGLTLTQQRFYANPRSRQADGSLWPIPLLGGDPAVPELLSEQQTTISTPAISPFKLNRSEVGFYFTVYSEAQRTALREAVMAGTLDVDDRLGILNEMFELARAGYIATTEVLELLDAYANETDEHVWDVMAGILGALRLLVEAEEPVNTTLDAYIRKLVHAQFLKLGFEAAPDEPFRTRLLRQTIIALACRAEEPMAVKEALERYGSMKQPEDIPADLRTVVYATAVRHGGLDTIRPLLERYRVTTFSEERINLAAGVCSTKTAEAIPTLLQFMQNEVKPQDVIYWYIYLIRNPVARQATWEWTTANWQWIIDTFGSDKHYDDFPKYSGRTFGTAEELAAYRAFFEPMLQDPALTRAINQGIESIDIRVQWRERDYQAVKDFLAKAGSR